MIVAMVICLQDIVQHTMNQIELLPSDGQSELVEKHIATDELR